MEIKVASKAGFCSGVKRALDLAMDTLKENKGPVSTLGPLVHNPQVVASLVEKGISVIDDVKDIQEGALVIRSHGVSPDVLVQARERGINIIDATCIDSISTTKNNSNFYVQFTNIRTGVLFFRLAHNVK